MGKNPYAAKSYSEESPKPSPSLLETVPDGSVKEIQAWVGDDPEKAKLALEKEEQGNQRKSLITSLKSIINV